MALARLKTCDDQKQSRNTEGNLFQLQMVRGKTEYLYRSIISTALQLDERYTITVRLPGRMRMLQQMV